MSPKGTVAPIIVAITLVAGTVLVLSFQAGQQNALASEAGTTVGVGRLTKGNIGSIQTGVNGQPEWIQTGIWVLRISSDSDNPAARLIARFAMVKPDGTALHVHKIYNFEASEITHEGNSTDVLKGTATVTMKDGPVSDVPLTVKVFNKAVIGFWIGPEKVDGHFGTGPVYGTFSANSREVFQDIHSMIQGIRASVGAGGQTNTIKMSAKEVDGVYRWSTDAGINPTLEFLSNANNVIQIQNPTDEKHELIIESDGMELGTSGDIGPDSSGQLIFNPTSTATLEYHCEYHPDTMKGTVEIANPA